MKRPGAFKARLRLEATLAVLAAGIYTASMALLAAADTDTSPKPDATPQTKVAAADPKLAGTDTKPMTADTKLAAAGDSKTKDPKPEKRAVKADAEKKKLTGQELYAIHCNRCHPERYPTEFRAAQWKTIMLEMRIRANLPASEAKAILKYLQDESPTP